MFKRSTPARTQDWKNYEVGFKSLNDTARSFISVRGMARLGRWSQRILGNSNGPRFLAEAVVEGGQLEAVGTSQFDEVRISDVRMAG